MDSKKFFFLIALSILFLGCERDRQKAISTQDIEDESFPIADSFVEPVPGNYYDAQPFGKNNHLGEDWNGPNGGNTDLGEPFYCIGNGIVVEAKNFGGGWGNVIIIRHKLPNEKYIESLYAHAESIYVQKGDTVSKGDNIGTIGNAGGIYYAHLHFEIRDSINMDIGGGYSTDQTGYLNPREFMAKYKK